MALDDNDIARIKLLLQEAVVDPINERINKHEEEIREVRQTVYGVNGDNGMRIGLKEVSTKVEGLLNSRAALVGGIAVLQFIGVLIIKLWK